MAMAQKPNAFSAPPSTAPPQPPQNAFAQGASRRAGQLGALLEASGIGLGQAYENLSLPTRPIDRISENGPSDPIPAELLQSMYMNNSPDLGMLAAPTMGKTPEQLGIVPSAEWSAQAGARLAQLQDIEANEAQRRKARRAAHKQRLRQHSRDYETPEMQAAVAERWRQWHEENS